MYIKKRNFQFYLEIGTRDDKCFKRVYCKNKLGVDPNSDTQIPLKSDDFFKRSRIYFDIILIDGLHHSQQVISDIINSINSLNKNGVIVLHDCNPRSYETQLVPKKTKYWNGDVWRAFLWARKTYPYYSYCIDSDEGIGIIDTAYFSDSTLFDINPLNMTYTSFYNNKDKYLNLISPIDLKYV